jgi:calcium-dependent protein kinase
MRDILRTVAQCHMCGVVHRDIKPENFLFHHDGEGAPLKAIDFGLAIYAPRGTVSAPLPFPQPLFNHLCKL